MYILLHITLGYICLYVRLLIDVLDFSIIRDTMTYVGSYGFLRDRNLNFRTKMKLNVII